jgi:hypothetical protein
MGNRAAGACRLFEVRASSLLRCNIRDWCRNILDRGKSDSDFADPNAIGPADIGYARALLDRRKPQGHLRSFLCDRPFASRLAINLATKNKKLEETHAKAAERG